jgi:hypothetical protein
VIHAYQTTRESIIAKLLIMERTAINSHIGLKRKRRKTKKKEEFMKWSQAKHFIILIFGVVPNMKVTVPQHKILGSN